MHGQAQPPPNTGSNHNFPGTSALQCQNAHATSHALIELRQDEIGEETGQVRWAAHMVAVMRQAAQASGLDEIRHFGSVNDTPTE